MIVYVIGYVPPGEVEPTMWVSSDEAEYTDFLARAARLTCTEDEAWYYCCDWKTECVFAFDTETGELEMLTRPNKGKP